MDGMVLITANDWHYFILIYTRPILKPKAIILEMIKC